MNKPMIRTIAAVGIALVLPAVAFAAALPGPGGTWTIAAGEEQTLVESDMTAYNALAKVVVNGSLTFNEVTTVPAVVMEGSGACTKTGTANWTLSTACPSYKGKWIIAGGTVDPSVDTAFGDTGSANNDASALYIRSGATLKLTAPLTKGYFLLYKWIHLAGTGVNGNGAIEVATNSTRDGYLGRIELDADATINMPSDMRVDFTYGEIRLDGHRLTFTGGQRVYFNKNEKFVGPGSVVMDTDVKFDFVSMGSVFGSSDPRIKIITRGGNEIRMIESSNKCPWPAQYADLEISGTLTLIHSHMSTIYTPVGRSCDHDNVWFGDVSVPTANDKFLVVCDQTAKNCMVTMSGNVSGAGSVQTFKSADDGYARIAWEGTNAFSGAMSAYLQNCGAVLLGNSNSVPDYAKFSATGGRVTLRLNDDGSRWCTNSIARFVNAATLNGNAVIGLDASCAPNGAATIDGSFWKEVKGGRQPVLVGDGGTAGLTGPLDDKYYRFGAVDGALKFTGEEPIRIGESYSYAGLNGLCAGTLLFENATDIHRGADGTDYGRILLPGCPAFLSTGSMSASAVGRMIVRNAKIVNDMLSANPTDVSKYPILLGTTYSNKSYPGILEIGAGADVTDRVIAGSGAAEAGAIYQSGGTLNNIGKIMSTSGLTTQSMGNSGFAYYELSGGTASLQGRHEPAYATDSEFVLMQTGGTFALDGNNYESPAWAPIFKTGNGRANIYVGGGTWTCGSYAQFVQETGTGSAVFTVDGAETSAYAESYFSYGVANQKGTFIINLNGGMLNVDYLTKQTASSQCKAYLNANGGTLRIRANKNPPNVSKIIAFPGGFVFSDNSAAQYTTFGVPIEAASGKGVSAVAVPTELANEILVGAPLVEIAETGTDGQGFGASAIALFDKETGKVTGVKVTSPGCDYTEATATFHYANKTWTSSCTLEENVTTGGFTKTGPGQLTFGVPNTYCGPTVVAQGGLIVGCDWGIPEGSELILNGGNVALSDYQCAFKSIGGTGGNVGFTGAKTFTVETLVPGTTDAVKFNNSTMKVTGETRFDVAKVLAGETTTYGTDITFDEGSTIAVDNVALLDGDVADKASPITLMTVTSGKQISGLPVWTNRPADGEWKLRVTLTSVKLVKQRGMLMIVR